MISNRPSRLVCCILLFTCLTGCAASLHTQSIQKFYTCPDVCRPPACFCARPIPPGNLNPKQTPQLIVMSFDDAVDQEIFDLVQQVIQTRKNPNGCPISATFFVSTDYTDYWLVQRLHGEGHEIAIHTMTHKTDLDSDLQRWRQEIVGARKALVEFAQIPKEKIVGFRAPYLRHNKKSFKVIFEEGFLYDSSITEIAGRLSKNNSNMIWPYTLDYGVAQRCFTGICPDEHFPGLFEVPLYALTRGNEKIAMDPSGSRDEIRQLLQSNFLDHYEGNRAPFGIFLHGHWLREADHLAALNDFLNWISGKPNVWFVSVSQLIDFMRNPKSSEQISSLFSCGEKILGPEVCDGLDNDGNGQIDENLVHMCQYPEGKFHSCAACPDQWPTLR